jgi:lysophospholipase
VINVLIKMGGALSFVDNVFAAVAVENALKSGDSMSLDVWKFAGYVALTRPVNT